MNGNMTTRGAQTIGWDVENRVISVTGGASFIYDGDGNRVKKTENNETVVYINQYYEKNITTGVITTYYYLGGKLVANRVDTTVNYLHLDHLGSTSVVSDSTGTQTETIRYFPFGGIRSGSTNADKKFTGQRLDATGLYYYGARYYDCIIGRFISADTVVRSLFNPQTLNRYSYCLNNPLKYIDPSGHQNELTDEEALSVIAHYGLYLPSDSEPEPCRDSLDGFLSCYLTNNMILFILGYEYSMRNINE